jgi:RNase adapter protein RapZ
MAAAIRIMSFAYSRGPAPEAELVADMRFLRNPHWQEELRHLTGLDPEVGAYISGDDAYADAMARIEAQLIDLMAGRDQKACVRVAFGCTGGRHRSVHVAERVAARLRAAGFSPSLAHRDLATPPTDGIERSAVATDAGSGRTAFKVDE